MSSLESQVGWLRCRKCRLHEGRTKVVLGRGNPNADIMFVGEAPGSKEDASGRPFVGPSGDMLDQFLTVFGLQRADIFVDNVVSCWPYVQDTNRRQSRKPSTEEIRACQARIQHSIYTVDPLIIITLGAPALFGLTGVTKGILAAAGEVLETTVPGWYIDVQYPVYAMYHPAYLLRQTPPDPNEKKPDERHPVRKTYKHFEDVLETLGLMKSAYYGTDM